MSPHTNLSRVRTDARLEWVVGGVGDDPSALIDTTPTDLYGFDTDNGASTWNPPGAATTPPWEAPVFDGTGTLPPDYAQNWLSSSSSPTVSSTPGEPTAEGAPAANVEPAAEPLDWDP